MSKGGFGSHWYIKGEQRVDNKEDASDMRIAKRRQAETKKMANKVLAQTIVSEICKGHTLSEFKHWFRPSGALGKEVLDMADLLGLTDDNSPPSSPPLSPTGALKHSKKRSKKKSKSKKKMRRSKTRTGSKLSKSERRSGKVRKKRTKRHKCKCKVCKCKKPCKCKSRSKSRSKRRSKSRQPHM
jgi:hypothetical protein